VRDASDEKRRLHVFQRNGKRLSFSRAHWERRRRREQSMRTLFRDRASISWQLTRRKNRRSNDTKQTLEREIVLIGEEEFLVFICLIILI